MEVHITALSAMIEMIERKTWLVTDCETEQKKANCWTPADSCAQKVQIYKEVNPQITATLSKCPGSSCSSRNVRSSYCIIRHADTDGRLNAQGTVPARDQACGTSNRCARLKSQRDSHVIDDPGVRSCSTSGPGCSRLRLLATLTIRGPHRLKSTYEKGVHSHHMSSKSGCAVRR
jgi:hypothetical protein